VRLHAVALGLHADDGTVRFRLWLETPLEPGESAVLNDERPVEGNIIAIEVFFLRLAVSDPNRVLNAYAKIETSDSAISLRDVEVGVNDSDGEPIDGETPIDDAPGLTVFARGDA
jgi:hypothetical protein